MLLDLPPHQLSVAVLQPQIAPNTGNIARLCVATGCDLHLVRPLGFVLSDRQLRRSAMDYWPRLNLKLHDSTEAFITSLGDRRRWLFDSTGSVSLWNATFRDGDILIFGSETKGLDSSILAASPERTIRLPQVPGERCLNLATSVGAAVYESLRKLTQASLPK